VESTIHEILNRTARAPDYHLTHDHSDALYNIQTCHTITRGGKLIWCQDCKSGTVFYHPCNQRGCPFCYLKNQIRWMYKMLRKLLPISHYHLIFSIPQAFTITWLNNKKDIVKILFSAVSQAIKEYGEDSGLMLGIILVFQSHGKGMCYKPHMHCILTAGGLSEKNEWIEIGSLEYKKLEDKFREKFNQEMEKWLAPEKLPDIKKIRDNEWRVHAEFHGETGKGIVNYLSHSIAGVVIDMKQNFQIDEEKGTIGFTERHDKKSTKTVLEKKTFTERYLNHIPLRRSVVIRSYGFYSNRYKKELEELRKRFPKCEEDRKTEIETKGVKCYICCSKNIIVIPFSNWENVLLLFYLYSHGPPGHGEVINIVKKVS